MKKSSLRNLGVMAVVLCLVTTCLLGGTLAKYTSTVNGSATVTAANWSFKAGSTDVGTDAFSVDLNNTLTTNIAAGKIAPGASGEFAIKLDAQSSDVGVDYSIVFSEATDNTLPSALKFTIESAQVELETPVTGKIPYDTNSANMTKTITVKWEWPYNADGSDNIDAGKSGVLNIAITGSQTQPEAAPGA